MSNREAIEEIVYTIRTQQGGEEALGNCIENAKLLKHQFEKEHPEWGVKISYGGLDFDGEPTPESYVHAKQTGTHHLWVVLHTDGSVWHCDLASESAMCFPPGSEPMIRKETPPEDYVDFGHRRES